MDKRNKDILAIAVPSVVSNITVPLLGLVDVSIVGHMGDAAYIGAISVGSMLFNVIYWIFGFLRMGTSGMTSQAYGRGKKNEAVDMLVRSLTAGVGVGVLFVVFQWMVRGTALWAMQPTEDILPYAVSYFNICIWGAPAVMGLYSLTGWYIGMQNTKVPMLVSISQNILNIAASLFFVYGLNLKVEGVALGTLLAQWMGFFMALIMLKLNYGRLLQLISFHALCDFAAMMRFFTINRDIFLRTLFLVAVNMFFTSAGAKQGAVILSVNTMLFQLFTLYSFVMDGFAYSGEAIGGRYFGAGDNVNFDDTVKRLFYWSLGLALVYTLLYYISGDSFFRLLTDEPMVLEASKEYRWWALAIPLAGMGAFYWDGLYIGMTATKGMLLSTFAGALTFFVVYWFVYPVCGNHALWLALILYLVMRGAVLTVLFSNIKK